MRYQLLESSMLAIKTATDLCDLLEWITDGFSVFVNEMNELSADAE